MIQYLPVLFSPLYAKLAINTVPKSKHKTRPVGKVPQAFSLNLHKFTEFYQK